MTKRTIAAVTSAVVLLGGGVSVLVNAMTGSAPSATATPHTIYACVQASGVWRGTNYWSQDRWPTNCAKTDSVSSWVVDNGPYVTTTTTAPASTSTAAPTTILRPTTTTAAGATTTTFAHTAGCANPVGTMANPQQTAYVIGTGNPGSVRMNTNVWGGIAPFSEAMSYCADGTWNLAANFVDHGGAIQAYPDTEHVVGPNGGKTVAQYSTISSCYGETHPASGWDGDFAYDEWLNNYGIEVMIWNRWTQTGAYPPSNARAVTIGGIPMHTWQGGGDNEWIYTMDTQNDAGCVDVKAVFNDLIAHPSTSGMTAAAVPNSLEYGVELAGTTGTQQFNVTTETVTAN